MGSRRKKFFALLIAAAVILYWRGLWALYDLFFEYTLPNNRILGTVISITIGALLLAGTGRLLDALVPLQLEAEIERDTRTELVADTKKATGEKNV